MERFDGFDAERIGRHPTVDGVPILIPRYGVRERKILGHFGGYGHQTIAQTIAQHEANRAIAYDARVGLHLGLVIDPETTRNQWPRRKRTPSFNRSQISFRSIYHPERDRLDPELALTYAQNTIAEQLGRGASIALTPYHFSGPFGSPGRRADVELANLAADHFHGSNLAVDQSREADRPRELYAAIAISAVDLSSNSSRERLVHAYASLAVTGYWVKIEGLHEASSISACYAASNFLFRLQLVSGRPVVAVATGRLYLALLANKLSAVSQGIANGERASSSPPPEKGHYLLPVYNGALIRNVAPQSSSVPAVHRARESFRKYPCECGQHIAEICPKGGEIKPHTLTLQIHETLDLGRIPDLEACNQRLDELLRAANSARASLQYEQISLKRWLSVSAAASDAQIGPSESAQELQ